MFVFLKIWEIKLRRFFSQTHMVAVEMLEQTTNPVGQDSLEFVKRTMLSILFGSANKTCCVSV